MATKENKSYNLLSNRFGTSHAFLIGINDYEKLNTLKTAVNDVQKIAAVLSQPIHSFKVHPLLLNALYDQIIDLIDNKLPELVKEGDRVVFYFAGHGVAEQEDNGPKGYILPADAEKNSRKNSISMNRLMSAFEKLNCRHFLLVLDCCFSGAFRWSNIESRDIGIPRKIFQERFDRYVLDPAWQVITSSAYDQKAIDIIFDQPLGKRENNRADHSPFAKRFIQGLQGKADLIPKENPDGLVTATELYLFLREGVENETISLDEELRQTPSFFPLKKHDKGEFLFLSPKHPLNLPNYDPARNPYKGLESYEMKDQELFYGRSQQTSEVFDLVNIRPFVVVSGASGTGKSSLIKAGVLPQLQKNGYQILLLRPGAQPLEELRNVLPGYKLQEEGKTVLFVDQFEELITRCSNKRERTVFIGRLKQLLDKELEDFKLIITVRSDFEPQFYDTRIGQDWKASRHIVPAFLPHELRELIEQPAFQNVLHFDPPNLVDTLINEVIQFRDALPLLSFTLSKLFEQYLQFDSLGSSRALTKEYYDKLGGVTGSLKTTADIIYNDLNVDQQKVMQEIMLRMVSNEGGELSSRRVYLEELIFTDPVKNKSVEYVKEKLIEARLIVTNRDLKDEKYIEPAHEALIKAWTRLRNWSEGFEDKLPVRNSLINGVVEYHNSNNSEKKLLYDDPQLDQFEVIRKSPDSWFNKREEEFVKKSVEIRTSKQKKRRINLVSIIIALLVLSLTAVTFGVFNKINADKAEKNARIADENAQIARDSTDSAIKQRQIAENKTLEAQIAKDSTIVVLSNLQKSNKKVVRFLLENADKEVLKLNYDIAIGYVHQAAQLKAAPESVSKKYLELAFWYGESGNETRAAGILDSAAVLTNRLLPQASSAKEIIKAFDFEIYQKMMARYYFVENVNLVKVKGGDFMMGCNSTIYCPPRELPFHSQTVDTFWISKYETTNWQYYLFCMADKHRFPVLECKSDSIAMHPVSLVNWSDAILYCNWVNKQLDQDPFYIRNFNSEESDFVSYYEGELKYRKKEQYRLPTEIEWEYATKGGGKVEKPYKEYSGSEKVDRVAWYSENSGGHSHPVGSLTPNELGLYDMSGNVWEWCFSWYRDYPLDSDEVYSNNYKYYSRVLRGGAWDSVESLCRSSLRDWSDPDYKNFNFGFRLVRDR